MTVEQFRKFYDAQPFRPFSIYLADGREIAARHREFLMPSPSGRTFAVYHPDDTCSVIELLLATELRARPSHNGTRKSRKQ